MKAGKNARMNDDLSRQPGVSWRNLREFRDVDLEASFVLSWSFADEMLRLEVDLVLLGSHPMYDKPRPSQSHCMRAAVIEFPIAEQLTLNGEWVAETTSGARLSSLQPGLLHTMLVKDEGHYVLDGEFGTVEFQSERPVLRILSH
jgi:hypothetical protein